MVDVGVEGVEVGLSNVDICSINKYIIIIIIIIIIMFIGTSAQMCAGKNVVSVCVAGASDILV